MPSELLSVSQAQERILNSIHPPHISEVSLLEASGRVLAADIVAPIDIPAFSNSGMDGFAVKVDNIKNASQDNPVELKIIGDIPAGIFPSMILEPGNAIRIMTGAPVPEGAEAIIPIENTDLKSRVGNAETPKSVLIYRPVILGENIRVKSEDVKAGEIVIKKGHQIRPQDIAFISMLGIAEVSVYSLPIVAIFSTGDELLPVGSPLTPGKIYETNSYFLTTLTQKYGATPIYLGIVPDSFDAILSCLELAYQRNVDLIISSAGVSVGAFDFVRSVVEEKGHLNFWRVNMRPGKPLAYGDFRNIPYLGLPGNPVSAFVGFEVFVRPVLLKLAGLPLQNRESVVVKLLEPIKLDGRESYLRAVITMDRGKRFAKLTGHQGSGNLRSLVDANALLRIPSGVESLAIGEEVEAWLLSNN